MDAPSFSCVVICGEGRRNGYTVFHFAVEFKRRRYVGIKKGHRQCIDEVYLEDCLCPIESTFPVLTTIREKEEIATA